jgi:hypothetical protein
MQGGDFGSSLMHMLEHQSVIVNARLKQSETSPDSSTTPNLLKPSKSNLLSRQITLSVDVKGVPFTQKCSDSMTVRLDFSNHLKILFIFCSKFSPSIGFPILMSCLKELIFSNVVG